MICWKGSSQNSKTMTELACDPAETVMSCSKIIIGTGLCTNKSMFCDVNKVYSAARIGAKSDSWCRNNTDLLPINPRYERRDLGVIRSQVGVLSLRGMEGALHHTTCNWYSCEAPPCLPCRAHDQTAHH